MSTIWLDCCDTYVDTDYHGDDCICVWTDKKYAYWCVDHLITDLVESFGFETEKKAYDWLDDRTEIVIKNNRVVL